MTASPPSKAIEKVPKVVAKEVEIFDTKELKELQDANTSAT